VRAIGSGAALAVALLTTACGGGNIGEVLGGVLGGGGGGGGSGTAVVEVQGVDQGRQQIVVATQDGQQVGVLYDDRTRVVYQDQQYPVTALERGDVVEMQVQETQSGYYTDYVLVRQSVQERRGQAGGDQGQGQLIQLAGEVTSVDSSRGMFVLRTITNQSVTVSLPYNPSSAVEQQFRNLRRGDNVSLEGYAISGNRLELVRFR